MAKSSKSVARVDAAATALNLHIEIQWLNDHARTAQQAADLIGCELGQIAKSLVFCTEQTRQLKLLLVAGDNQVDMDLAARAVGAPLIRAQAAQVRTETGFAIGGVAPIGHLTAPDVFMDETLMRFDTVWAAAGHPETVFAVRPDRLADVTRARLVELAS